MTNKIFLIIILAVFSSCEKKLSNSNNNKLISEKKVINTILDDWHKSASEAKFDSYFDAMAANSVFIATDAKENWNKKDFEVFSKPFFDRGEAWDFKPVKRNIYISARGNTAWFDELLNTWMGVCRGSGVLSKIDNTWKIEQYVLSVTIPNEHITEIINIKKEKDSLFLSRLNQ
ncbi:MAG: nuclear transport factor 2 family protein [Lutibacter sp.]